MIYRDSDIGSLHLGCPDAICQFEIRFYILQSLKQTYMHTEIFCCMHIRKWGVCVRLFFLLLFHTKQVLHVLKEETYLNFSVVDYSFFSQ